MIEVKNLVKKYGNHLAVDHLNFKGEITERFTVEDAGEHIGTRRAIVRAAAEIGRNM